MPVRRIVGCPPDGNVGRVLTDGDVRALVGRRFPGGERTVERWENWLLTDCTRRSPMPGGLLHPIVLFHVPVQGAGVSIGELFAICGGDGSPGSVTLLGYDWEYLSPMHEGDRFTVTGGITDVVRTRGDGDTVLHDDVTFSIELAHPTGERAARVTNRWRFRRSGTAPHADAPARGTGVPIPSLEVAHVGVDRMKTFAALLRDPYPIHWDPDAVRAAGQGERPVNQGPLNLSYVANMLMAWAGEGSIRRLTVGFHGRVFDGDTVVAGGSSDERVELDGEPCVRCTVWLDRGDERLVSGTALVRRPG